MLSLFAGGNHLSTISGYLLSHVASNSLLSTISDDFLSPLAGGSLLSTVSGRFLSLVTDSSPLSVISGCFSSLVAGGAALSAISGRLLSSITGGSSLSTISSCFSSFVANDSPLSAVFVRFLSLVIRNGLLFTIFDGDSLSPLLSTCSWALFLTSTLSYAHRSFLPPSPLFHSSLPSLPTPLAHNPTSLTGKRLFDQVFITQRPIAST